MADRRDETNRNASGIVSDDLTTAAIEAAVIERARLRAEIDQLTKIGDLMFQKGYDQAVREIRDHFAKAGDHGLVHVIETIWKVAFEKELS